MDHNNILTLDENEPRVIAARDAERRLFDFYGLETKTHYIFLPQSSIRVRVTEIGSGEPVLIVPGNTGDVFPLIPLIAGLKGRRILALNRPGGGLSEGINHRKIDLREFAVQTITAVLDAFGIDKVPIIAHSIGGHMSLWMAMDRPEHVSTLILLGVPGNIISTKPPFVLRLLSIPVLNRFLFNLVSPRSPKQSLRGLFFMGHSPEVLARLPEAMADCYYYFQKLPHYLISALSLMERGNLFGAAPQDRINAEQLKQVRQPVMFLWGTNDPFGSVETGRQISEFLPDSEFHAIAGGGHLPWLDEPDECSRLALDFLSSHQNSPD
jgi:2-hydroxy-6-oxonona-2,4-dienedioate hydrolase